MSLRAMLVWGLALLVSRAGWGAEEKPPPEEGTPAARPRYERFAARFRYDLAGVHLAYQDYRGAQVHLAAALAAQPGAELEPYLRARLAEAYGGLEQYDQAVAEWEAAIKQTDNAARQRAWRLEKARLLIQAGGAGQDRYPEAEIELEKILAEKPPAGVGEEARRLLVTLYEKSHRLASKIKELEGQARKTPPDQEALRLLAEIHRSVKRDPEALVGILRQLAAALPTDAEVLYQLASAQRWAKKYQDAAETYLQLAGRDPENAAELLEQAGYLFVAGQEPQPARCEAVAEKLLRDSPAEARAALAAAHLYLQLGQHHPALAAFRKAESLFPVEAEKNEVRFEMAELFRVRGQPRQGRLILETIAATARDAAQRERARRALRWYQ